MLDVKNTKVQRVALLVFFAFVIGGIIIEAIYALPYRDDFDYFLMMKRELAQCNNAFLAAFRIAKNYYFIWSGDYLSVFLIPFLNPFSNGGTRAVSALVFFSTVFFFISVFVFFRAYSEKKCNGDKNVNALFFSILLVIGWFGTNIPDEFFYWYTCAYSYCLGTAFLLLLSSALIRNKNTVVIIILSFFAIGMSIQTAFMGLGLLVVYWLNDLFQNKKKGIIISLFVIIEAISVLAAPGNTSRDYSSGANDSLLSQGIQGFVNSTRCIARIGIKKILISPYPWIIIAFAIIVSLFTNMNKQNNHSISYIIKRIIASIVIIYATVFPVCFGYRLSFMSPRTESIAMVVIWIIVIDWIFWLAQFIKNIPCSAMFKHRACVICSSLLFLIVAIVFLTSDNSGIRAYKEIIGGKAKMQWDNWSEIYAEVDVSDKSVIEVDIDNEYISGLMVQHDLVEYEDGDRISNRYMEYCEKERLTVNWHDERGSVFTLDGYGARR